MTGLKKIFPALFVSLVISVVSFAQSPDTIINSIIFSGNIKGFDKTWKNADGSYSNWYQYNDRGRGDSIRIAYRQDEQGFPTQLTVSGKDYMKNNVEESFSLLNGIAKWKNIAENEEKAVSGKLFYVGLKGNGGNLIKALKANNNKIRLLPYGEINLQVLQQHTIGSGANVKTVSLCSLSGFSMTPSYSWIDEQDEAFASVSNWFSTIRRGYESYTDTLLAIQKKIESSFYSKLAGEIPEKINGVILVQNVNVFDSENAKLITGMDVYISNGKIEKLVKHNAAGKHTGRVIDGSGKTLIPGLWDMHVHFSDDLEGILHVAAGVTHVRDMGNGPALPEKINRIKSREIIGPAVEIMSGFIDGAGPFAAPTGALINNIEEGKKYIKEYAEKGYQQIKLYSSIKPEWVEPLIDEAKKYKMRVCGHIPAFMTASQAVIAGYDEITHMNMLALNFWGDTVDTRSPLRFSLPAQKAASLELNGNEMKTFIQLLKTKKTVVDPTITVFEGLFIARDGRLPASFSSIVHRFPIQMQRNIRAGGGGVPVPEGMDETYLKSFEAFLKITKLLYDNGIPIVAGTDGFAGFDLHRELELYVRAGIPAEKVLQLATHGTASIAGKANESGSIKAGRKADLVLIDGNPLNNISDVRKTEMVIKGEMMYSPAKLYKAVSIKPYKD